VLKPPQIEAAAIENLPIVRGCGVVNGVRMSAAGGDAIEPEPTCPMDEDGRYGLDGHSSAARARVHSVHQVHIVHPNPNLARGGHGPAAFHCRTDASGALHHPGSQHRRRRPLGGAAQTVLVL
jgi:hypothetical protein